MQLKYFVKIEKFDIMSKVSTGKVGSADGRYNAQNQLLEFKK